MVPLPVIDETPQFYKNNGNTNHAAGDEKGLSQAFYDALVANPEVLRNMEDSVLVEMAYELTNLIRKSRTVDWDKKESARAYSKAFITQISIYRRQDG